MFKLTSHPQTKYGRAERAPGRITPEEADRRISAEEPVYVQMREQRCRVANIRITRSGLLQARIALTNQWVDNPLFFADPHTHAE